MSISFPKSVPITLAQPAIIQNNDLYGGKTKLFVNRKVYIPQLGEQEEEDYDSMVTRAPVYVLYPAIVEGFLGSIFTKTPQKVLPDDKVFENIDLLGNTIDEYSTEVMRQVLKQGFCATVVDYSDSKKQPFLKFITPESFVSFKVESVDDAPRITRFIFEETLEKDNLLNEFDTDVYMKYTVLDIFNGVYRVRIYESDNDEGIYQVGEDIFPEKNLKPLSRIPIVIHGTDANNYDINRSRLQDISDLNISVYQRTVDQVHMLHYTALPTPYVTGVDAEDPNKPTTIGPQNIWFMSNPESKAGLLEFSGASAKAHQDFIDAIKEIMAAIGAQLLKDQGISRETATSVLIRNNSQTITISAIVNNVTLQMLELLNLFADWAQLPTEDIEYKLNADLIRVDMDANGQIALVKSWMDNAISKPSMFAKLKEGEIVPADRTFEQEEALIAKYPSKAQNANLDKTEAETKQIEKETSLADKIAMNSAKSNPDSTGKGQTKKSPGSNLETGNKTGDALSTKQV